MITVHFIKSDAAAEAFPNEPDGYYVEMPEPPQLTYTELRETQHGAPIAWLDRQDYWVTMNADHLTEHWSDVTFEVS
jgi:hypothetical protein